MKTPLRAVGVLLMLTLVTGVGYPLVVTAVAQVAFDARADGSLVSVDGEIVGSTSIGQVWEGDGWFHGRPSAVDHDASTSGGSNLGPTSADLARILAERVDAVLALERPNVPGLTAADVPVDLVTASASGLDPHISVAAADLQAPRVAAVSGLTLDEVIALIRAHTAGPTWGFLGAERVNVLELNLAVRAEVGRRATS